MTDTRSLTTVNAEIRAWRTVAADAQQANELAKAEAVLSALWQVSFTVFGDDQETYRVALLPGTVIEFAK